MLQFLIAIGSTSSQTESENKCVRLTNTKDTTPGDIKHVYYEPHFL